MRIHYDSTGQILGCYPEQINYDILPQPLILISDYIWYSRTPKAEYRIINNELALYIKTASEIIKENAQKRTSEIDRELSELDKKSIRALREQNATRLSEYENKAKQLRTERITCVQAM